MTGTVGVVDGAPAPPDGALALLDGAVMIAAPAGRDAVVRLTGRLALPASSGVRRARLAATAHGVYQASIGGRPVGDSLLDPGWTAYEWRLAVQEHDVTALVADAGPDVALDLLLGGGWYRGDLGFDHAEASYGEDVGVIAALRVELADGSTRTLRTSTGWTATTTSTTSASIYHGQRVDTLEAPQALAVTEVAFVRGTLVPQVAPPVVRQDELAPTRIWQSPSGTTLVDFGQNLVGWVRLSVTGPAGTTVQVRHAEVLEHDELGTRPLRTARATDTYLLSGGADVFEPTFTFHGFRYAEVTGWPGDGPTADDLVAVVVGTALRPTGAFTCSDPLVDRLVENARWSQRGNFLSVPTDCPQRDERLGWTGDLAVFAPTAAQQFDVADFLHGWLLDLAAETAAAGAVPVTVPDLLKHARPGRLPAVFGQVAPTAIWGDAAVWVPQALWQAYGDLDRLAAHYPGMVAHLRSVQQRVSPDGVWDTGFQFGDWLDPDASPHEPWAAKADPGVVATACLYRSASFAALAADLLGLHDDAAAWSALAARTRSAFTARYVRDGRVHSDCVTVYALAIRFGLLDDADRSAAGDRLAELVQAAGYRVTTGFAGTPYVTWALTDTGHVETAYRLLLETSCPSWLYPVTMGATTIWERWDSMLPDGSINPGEMTSFNHYALGAVVDWLYQVVAGIRPDLPGYARVLVAPTPGPGLDHMRAHRDVPAGRVRVEWRTGATFELDVELPDCLPARVVLPDGSAHDVVGGAHHWSVGG